MQVMFEKQGQKQRNNIIFIDEVKDSGVHAMFEKQGQEQWHKVSCIGGIKDRDMSCLRNKVRNSEINITKLEWMANIIINS